MERKVYKVWCPTPSHRREWTDIPPPLAHLPLRATGAPGANPQLIQALRVCPRCVVRVMMARWPAPLPTRPSASSPAGTGT